MDLDADSDALTALAGDSGSDDAIPPEAAKFLSGLRVDVAVKSKKALADSGQKDLIGTSMKITGADGVLVEYRIVGDFTYYRINMKAVGKAMGVPMPTADELPDSEKEFKHVLEGDWVKMNTHDLEKAQKSSQGSTKERTAPPTSMPRPSGRSSRPYAVSSPTTSPSAPRTAVTAPNMSSPAVTSVP